MGDPDAGRHGQSDGAVCRDPVDAVCADRGGEEQRQLIQHHQQIALVGVEAEEAGADMAVTEHGGVDHQTGDAGDRNDQGGYIISGHFRISFSSAISAA